MSTFKAVDTQGRLWQVSDLLPPEQAEQFARVDWHSLQQGTSRGQEGWPRKQVQWDDPQAQRLGQLISNQLPAINRAIGTEFTQASGHFWIDQPGFVCAMHTDGHLANSMQLYWLVAGPEYGTGFYHYNNPESLLYQFDSRPNTGYIMLNHLDPDGSQPLLWHAMFQPVPEGTIRVSSYWQFS